MAPDFLSTSYFTGAPPWGISMTTLTSCGGLSPIGMRARSMGRSSPWATFTSPRPASGRGSRWVEPALGSKHLEHLVDRAGLEAPAGRDRHDAVEPVVFLRPGVEERGGAEIVCGRIDRVTPVEARDHIGRPVPQPAIGHADEMARGAKPRGGSRFRYWLRSAKTEKVL